MMGFYTPNQWGFDNKGQHAAAELVNKYGAGKVRRMACVYYQCKQGHPLGFAWPIVRSDRPELKTAEHELLVPPGVYHPFEHPITVDNPVIAPPDRDFVFFAHRRRDTEFEFYGDPANALETVGWAPAGAWALKTGETSFNVSRSVNFDQQVAYAKANGETAPESEKSWGVTGRRDVIEAVTGWRWQLLELQPPAVDFSNPPGMVNCKCTEVFLSRDKVVADIAEYRKRPIIL